MHDDLARAYAFIARADMAGTRTEPFRWGRAVFMPECPLRYDSNYLLVADLPAAVDADALAAEADRIQGGAGLAHRSILVTDAARGDALTSDFAGLGWECFQGLVMDHRGPGDGPVDTSRVEQTEPERLRAIRTEQLLGYPWGTPEVARQLLDARSYIPVETRTYAVFEAGEPVSWCELYLDAGTAQVESVATVEAHRNRGHARAVVGHAVNVARDEGADLVFLVSDADDWPQVLYRRLGFETLGRYRKFNRPPPSDAP